MRTAIKHDISAPLSTEIASADDPPQAECASWACGTSPGSFADEPEPDQGNAPEPVLPAPPPAPTLPPAAIAVEQTSQGPRPAARMVESFDGLGSGFLGLNGVPFRNPSDNSLAVGPDHIVQIVNSRIAIYSKKGRRYPATGTVLYGATPTRSVWAGFGGVCEARNNGDAVVRYDQLAGRWLIVMPIFSRIDPSEFPGRDALASGEPVPPGQLAKSGEPSSPGPAAAPPANLPPSSSREPSPLRGKNGVWAICYAVSTGSDPLAGC